MVEVGTCHAEERTLIKPKVGTSRTVKIFFALVGIAAAPTAARYGWTSWEFAALPLACKVIMVYICWNWVRKKENDLNILINN
jgi:hypothetical protein